MVWQLKWVKMQHVNSFSSAVCWALDVLHAKLMFYHWVISATLWHLGFWYNLRACNAFPCNSSHLLFAPWESELKVDWVVACALCCTFSSNIISICFSLPWFLSAPSLLKFLKPLSSGSQTCVSWAAPHHFTRSLTSLMTLLGSWSETFTGWSRDFYF